MHRIRINAAAIAAAATHHEYHGYDFGAPALEEDVQSALNLFLDLKNPAQMLALLEILKEAKPAVQAALKGLHYVHFARFLPSRDGATLMVITEYDGDLNSYLMDFVAVLGPAFNAILEFIKDAPRLPVEQYPQDFLAFVARNNLNEVKAWSAYPQKTVIDIQGPRRTLPPPVESARPATIDLRDIQGNILRGYRVHYGRHFALAALDAAAARRFVAGLVSGDEDASPQVTTAAHWSEHPPYLLNIGLTWSGLQALGIPAATLQNFPEAFRVGPADPDRAKLLGDTGASAPQNWILGNPAAPAHLVISLYADGRRHAVFEQKTKLLRQLFAANGLKELSCHDATAMPQGSVHFGYKDGIGQPCIAGTEGRKDPPDMQPAAGAGDFLLGRGYVNQYGGNFIGDLPSELCDNAIYGVLRILQQDVDAFESLIRSAGVLHNMDPELVAAKLMGRWRGGAPLTLAPEAPPDPAMHPHDLNDFDFAPTAAHPTYYDDEDGLRCPVGSHIRRLNPRGGLVTGKPYSRRIIRRGIPYGPGYDPARPRDGVERGLMGLFLCGDLEMQFEFLQAVWANGDISTRGLQDTRDPILGAHPPEGGRFVIRTGDARDPIVLDVPRLVTTRGTVYLLMPGIGGLKTIAAL